MIKCMFRLLFELTFKAGMLNLWFTGHMWPDTNTNTAAHSVTLRYCFVARDNFSSSLVKKLETVAIFTSVAIKKVTYFTDNGKKGLLSSTQTIKQYNYINVANWVEEHHRNHLKCAILCNEIIQNEFCQQK